METNDKNHKLKTTYQTDKIINDVLIIKTNTDWKNYNAKNNPIVNINNNDYFGIRVYENKALAIIYNPILITNLKKILKEGKRFSTTHFITFDLEEFNPLNKNKYSNITEWFLKETTKIISDIEEIKTDNLVLNIVDNEKLDLNKIIITLSTIYKYKIAVTTTKKIENNNINFVLNK